MDPGRGKIHPGSESQPSATPASPGPRIDRQASLLDAILAATPDLVYLCDRRGVFLYANQAGAALWGLDRDALVGRSWRDLGVPPDVAATFEAQCADALKTGQTIRDGVTLAGPVDLVPRYFQYGLSPLEPKTDRVSDTDAVVFTLRDTTEERQDEEALRESEEKYRLLAENSTDMISRHDASGVYLYASPACRGLLGYEPAELVGRSAYDLIHPDDRAEVSRVHSELLQTSETFTVVFRVLRKDGTPIWSETTTRTVRSPWTGVVLEIHCASRDVTARRQAEEALRQSEEKFRGAFESAAVGIGMVDPSGRWLRANPALCEIVGYAEAELLKKTFRDITHPDDLPSDLAQHARLLAGEIDSYRTEKRYIHRQGHTVWVVLSVSLVRDAAGQPLYQVGLVEDISRRHRAEDQLRAQNARLAELVASERQAHQALKQAESQLVQAEKLTALGQLVAGVAHEINNPLAFVLNNLAVLQRDVGLLRSLLDLYGQSQVALAGTAPDLLARIQKLADEIDLNYTLESLERLTGRSSEGLRRIRQIVVDLRDFARLDESEVNEVDLNAGIRATANIISGRARDCRVSIALDLGEIPRIVGAPGKLNQVVLNLLSNAIDASPPDGTVTIRTRSSTASEVDDGGVGSVEIHVIDQGRGIDPAIRARIFDPFFTTKPIGQGTGLGLSLCYGVIHEHGGTIRVESEPGHGAHFIVTLPLTMSCASDQAPPSPPGPDHPPETSR